MSSEFLFLTAEIAETAEKSRFIEIPGCAGEIGVCHPVGTGRHRDKSHGMNPQGMNLGVGKGAPIWGRRRDLVGRCCSRLASLRPFGRSRRNRPRSHHSSRRQGCIGRRAAGQGYGAPLR